MDLRQIETFVRVAELGSFTRASVALGVAQPALSRQVRSLELEFRQALLLRNGRGVTVTEAGRVLLEQGRGVLHQVQRIREELGRARDSLAGRVVLGLPPSLSKTLAIPLARSFHSALPQATLSIAEGLSTTMQQALVAGRVDVALLFDAAPEPDIDARALGALDLLLVRRHANGAAAVGAGAPRAVSLRELARQPLIIPSRPNAIRMLVEAALNAIGAQPRIAFEVDAVGAIPDLVADGRGAAVLTRGAVDAFDDPARFSLRGIGDPPLRCRLSLAVSARRPPTRTLALACELISRCATRMPGVRPIEEARGRATTAGSRAR
ncbi:MAG: LysR family transcriptional regulator [Lautropia sp.]